MTPSLPALLQARLPCRGRAPVGCHEGEEGRNSGSETGTTVFTLRGEEEFQKNSRRIPCSPVSTGEGRQGTERRGECGRRTLHGEFSAPRDVPCPVSRSTPVHQHGSSAQVLALLCHTLAPPRHHQELPAPPHQPPKQISTPLKANPSELTGVRRNLQAHLVLSLTGCSLMGLLWDRGFSSCATKTK